MLLGLLLFCIGLYLGRKLRDLDIKTDEQDISITELKKGVVQPTSTFVVEEDSKAVIVDPDDIKQVMEYTKREHEEKMAKLNAKP